MSDTDETVKMLRAAGFQAMRVDVVQGKPPPPLQVRMTIDEFERAKAEAREQGRRQEAARCALLIGAHKGIMESAWQELFEQIAGDDE
jgi:hypothetical protein